MTSAPPSTQVARLEVAAPHQTSVKAPKNARPLITTYADGPNPSHITGACPSPPTHTPTAVIPVDIPQISAARRCA
jgi:hypothetical protein